MTPSVNIALQLSDWARQQPHKTAITEQKSGRHCSYQQLDQDSDRLACGLRVAGIGPGIRTVLMVVPDINFFTLVFALFKTAATIIMIDPGIGRRHIKQCLHEAEPQAFIGSSRAHLARCLFGWARQTISTRIFSDGGYLLALMYHAISLDKIRQLANPSELITINNRPDDIAAILFTSGSTGSPKGAVYTHANFSAQVQSLRQLYDIQPDDRDISTFPLFALFATVMGMTTIIPDMDFTRPARVNPQRLITAIENHAATSLFGSPALLDRLSRYGQQHHKKLPSVKRVLSAGAPVANHITARMVSMLDHHAQMHTPYGATEGLPISSISSQQLLRSARQQTAMGKGICVGQPVDNIELKIIAISDHIIPHWQEQLSLATGSIGEIIVKGPQITASYYGRPQHTAQAKISDPAGGFYHRMGDAGYLDKHGDLWFCGRISQSVIISSQTLFTACCEGIFNNHPRVHRSALVGVPTDQDTIAAICIELAQPDRRAERHTISQQLLELAATFEQTQMIKHILFHPSFPVDIRHNAKIKHEELALWATCQLQA